MESCERECSYRSVPPEHQKVEEKEHEGRKRLESASSSQNINRGWDEGDEFSPEQAQHLKKKQKSATPTPRRADGELQGWYKYSCTYTYGRSVSLPTVSPSEARRTLSPLTPSCSPLGGGNNPKLELRVRCDVGGDKRPVDGVRRQTDAEREKEGHCWRNDHPNDRHLEEESEYQDDDEEEETFIVNVSSTFMNAEQLQEEEGKEGEKRMEEPLYEDLHHQVKGSPCILSDPAFPESSSCRRACHDPPTITIFNSFGSVSPVPTELSFLHEKEFTATSAITTTTEGSDKTKNNTNNTQKTEKKGCKKTESGSSCDVNSLRDTTIIASLSDARPLHSFNSRHQSSMSCQLSTATLAQIEWVRKHLKAKSNTANDEDGGDETVPSDHGVRGPRYRKRKEMKNKEKRETKESAGSSLSSSSSLQFSSAECSLSDDNHGRRESEEVDWSASPLSRYLKLMSPTNTTTRARSVPTQPSTNSPQRDNQQERDRRSLPDCDNNDDDDDVNDVDSMIRHCADRNLPPSDDGRSIVINGSICLQSSFLAIEEKEKERESDESLLYPSRGVPPPTAVATATTASPQRMVILMLNLFSGSESSARRAVEVEEERDRSQCLEVAFVKMSVAELGRLASGLLTENASLRKRLKAASKKKKEEPK